MPYTVTPNIKGTDINTIPNLSSTKVAGALDSPYSVLDNGLVQLQNYYKGQQEKLKTQRPTQEQWNKAIAGMQEDYDQQKFKIESIRSQLKDVEVSIKDPDLANEAMWRLVLPPEHAAAMFPKPATEQRGRFTPGEFQTYKKQFATDIAGAEEKPWFGRNYVDPDKLKQSYLNSRDAYGYDQMNSSEKRSFDMAWDSSVNSSGKKFSTVWSDLMKNDPELFSSRTYGNRLLNVAAKKVSPLAASIQKQGKTWGWPTLTKPGYRDRSGEGQSTPTPTPAPAPTPTPVQVPEPKTQAEYDAMPSGTTYRDTDGQLKRKK